jgi:hypothetical protein
MNANKGLLALVIGMGVIVLLGVGVLAYGLMQRASNPNFSFFKESAVAGNVQVALPDGATVQQISTVNNLLAVHVIDGQDRDSVLLIDPTDGHIVRRLDFRAAQ